jgi:hypothetical protein
MCLCLMIYHIDPLRIPIMYMGTFSRIPKFDERLDNMWLSLNTRKWYLDSQLPTQELGLVFPIVHATEDLPYMMDCLLKICEIFPTFKFP